MKNCMAVLVLGCFLISSVAVASASSLSIANGSFETGNFTGWSASGYGTKSVVLADAGYTATDGAYFANLSADSTLSQGVSWSAGDVLNFDWNFNSNDYLPYNDWSIFRVNNSVGLNLFNLTLATVQSVGNYSTTGWNSYSYTFATAGAGSIDFGVYNSLDYGLPSQLYVDNVNAAAVPEPGTVMLLGIGIAGVALYGKRRKDKMVSP